MNDEKTPYELIMEHIENASNKTRSGPFIRYDEVKLKGKSPGRGFGKRSAIEAYINAL
jgi:hypothetical protein